MPDQNAVHHRETLRRFLRQKNPDSGRLHPAGQGTEIFRVAKGVVFRHIRNYRDRYSGLLPGLYQTDEAVHLLRNQVRAGNDDFTIRFHQIPFKHIRKAFGIIDSVCLLLFHHRIRNDAEADLFIGFQSFPVHSLKNRDVGIDIIIHDHPLLSSIFPAQSAHILLQPPGKGDRSRQHQGIQPWTVEAFPDFLSGGD